MHWSQVGTNKLLVFIEEEECVDFFVISAKLFFSKIVLRYHPKKLFTAEA